MHQTEEKPQSRIRPNDAAPVLVDVDASASCISVSDTHKYVSGALTETVSV